MTNQELFDKSVKGILDQGGPAMNTGGSCRYRGKYGRKCAAGHLIDDDNYDPDMEGSSSDGMLTIDGLDSSGVDMEKQGGLVGELQSAHDRSAFDLGVSGDFFSSFKKRVTEVAMGHDLNLKVLG